MSHNFKQGVFVSYSYVTYTGDGTTQDYIVPFPCL